MKISGSITALITPFKDGKFDEHAYGDFINWQIEEGTQGLVPSGTTGESPTLDHDEHQRVIEVCVEAAAGRVPVIAGTGSNSTLEASQMSAGAAEAGADAVLIMTPYYNKPTQEGIYQHFRRVHDDTDIDIILYNIPGRSVVDISDATLARLLQLPRVIGIKDATGDLSRIMPLKRIAGDLGREGFIQLSGEDATAYEFNRLGGVGCISVTSNIAPRMCAQMQELTLAGKWDEAEEINRKLMPLHDAMFCETSPIPVKYAASLIGMCEEEYRLPLVPPSDGAKEMVKRAMEELGLCGK